MRNHLTRISLFVACLLAACSSEPATGSTDGECPAGEASNPITAECEPISATDTGSDGVVTSPPDAASAADDSLRPPDVATRDVPAPRPDAAPDMPPADEVVRFVAIGDTGTGSDDQRLVGRSIGEVCETLGGCDFGLLLGDNFYNSGVDSVDDSLFVARFVDPYGHLPFPFWAVLGNHDLGGDGLGVDLDQNKADYQVQYSGVNPQWRMPARFYAFSEGPLHFVALDTTAVFFGDDDDQRDDVPRLLQAAGDRWKIAFGHHPYYSNGPHGNAGEYEGLPFVPIANGEHVRSFLEDRICGNFDFYLCGHDHSRQDIVDDCEGTQFIVSGAGAKTTELEGDNPVHFQADTEGFLLMEATDDTMTIRFYDKNGGLEHTRVVAR